MRLGIFALAVSLAAIVVTVALDVRRDERRARQLAECNATRLALQDEVQRQWRRSADAVVSRAEVVSRVSHSQSPALTSDSAQPRASTED